MSDIKEEIDQNDLDLEFVRQKRKEIINSLTANGVPGDNDKVQILLGALSDMDRTSLSKKKIKVDKDVGNNQAQAMELIATMFSDTRIKKYGVSESLTNRELPQLSNDIPEPILVDGETSQQAELENYDSFMARINK